jgi:hypothetical protein
MTTTPFRKVLSIGYKGYKASFLSLILWVQNPILLKVVTHLGFPEYERPFCNFVISYKMFGSKTKVAITEMKLYIHG